MKSASMVELKEELASLPARSVMELCLRMARYKKENKELLTYILFESHNEQGFLEGVKKEIDEQFAELPKANAYMTKKSLRKLLRSLTRHSRHSGIKESEVEILIHFCSILSSSGILNVKNKALSNLYNHQVEKLKNLSEKVHEDLQFDYKKQIKALER